MHVLFLQIFFNFQKYVAINNFFLVCELLPYIFLIWIGKANTSTICILVDVLLRMEGLAVSWKSLHCREFGSWCSPSILDIAISWSIAALYPGCRLWGPSLEVDVPVVSGDPESPCLEVDYPSGHIPLLQQNILNGIWVSCSSVRSCLIFIFLGSSYFLVTFFVFPYF